MCRSCLCCWPIRLARRIDPLLEAFNAYYVGAPVMGGMASSAQYAGANALILNDEVRSFGAVGVALSGNVAIDVVVSQGCRPIGHTYKVTGTSEDMIFSLNGGSPLKQVQEMVNELSEEDHALLQQWFVCGSCRAPHLSWQPRRYVGPGRFSDSRCARRRPALWRTCHW